MPSGDIGILTTDAGLVIRSWNAWLEAATGIAAGDACGRPLEAVAPDLAARGLLARLQDAARNGTVQVLAATLHRFLIPCPPREPSPFFDRMQQHVTVGPVHDADGRIDGLVIAIEDATPRLDAERALADDLTSDDADRRASALARMAGSPVESFEGFSGALANDDWRVRRAAVDGLAGAASAGALRSLVDALRNSHRNFNALSSALKILAATDEDLTSPLTALLHDADADLRMQAALALGEQHNPAAAEPLVRALDDPDTNVRFHAIEALGRLRTTAAVDRLIEIAEEADFFLAFAALDALALINDPRIAGRLVPLLDRPEVRDAAIRTLGLLADEDAVTALAAALNTLPGSTATLAAALVAIHDRHAPGRAAAAADVIVLTRDAIDQNGRRHLRAALEATVDAPLPVITLVGWLRDPDTTSLLVPFVADERTRTAAVHAITALGPAGTGLLLACGDSDDPEVAGAVIAGLARAGDARAIPFLVRALTTGGTIGVSAAGALARLAHPDAAEALLAQVGTPDAALRRAIVGAINAIGHPDLPGRCLALLHDADPVRRESGARIAGYFGFRETADALLALTADPVEAVRIAAVEHLPFMDDERAIPALLDAAGQPSPQVRAAAARALGRVDDARAATGLQAALEDADIWVRYYAARSLGAHRDAESTARLERAAASDPAVPVRIAALEALAASMPVRGERVILACCDEQNDDVAAAALRAAGRLSTDAALAHLLHAAASDIAVRRDAAIAGLVDDASEGAVDRLQWMAAGDAPRAAVEACVAGLGRIAGTDGTAAGAAVESLLSLSLEPATADIAHQALLGLPASRIPDVAAALKRPAIAARRLAVQVLADFRSADATRHLVGALEDADPGVREGAAHAIARLGARIAPEPLERLAAQDPSKSVRRAAAYALARIRGEA